MAQVKQHKDAAGAIVADVYDRVETEGDAIRFAAAENGHREMIHVNNTAVAANGIAKVTVESGSHLFQLDFDYIVGANQLEVLIPNTYQYTSANRIEFAQVASIDERNQAALPGWTGPAASQIETYFEEVGSNTVRVYGVPSSPGIVLFRVPHTALPAALRGKVIVLDQGDQVAVELRGEGDGVIMRAPNGSKFLVRVDNSGVLTVEPR